MQSCHFLFNWRDYEWALKKSLSLTEILVFKKNCMSSKEKTLRVTRLTGKVINIEQAYNAINCQVETRGYYSQFIDSFSIQISLTTSATVATSKLFCIHQVEICGSCIHPSSFNTNNFSLDLSLKTSTEILRLFFITKYLIHN